MNYIKNIFSLSRDNENLYNLTILFIYWDIDERAICIFRGHNKALADEIVAQKECKYLECNNQ
ncbi:MAG: hypothetical protein ACFFBI_02720 [Promethearchaeota archaeon]